MCSDFAFSRKKKQNKILVSVAAEVEQQDGQDAPFEFIVDILLRTKQ